MDAMADCDVAAFVYDSSDAVSWNRAQAAAHGEITGQEVPCLLIATKDDLEPDSSVDAAQRPHLSIPETEQGKTQKHRRRLIQRSLAVAAVRATVTVAGIAVYRVYVRRKVHRRFEK